MMNEGEIKRLHAIPVLDWGNLDGENRTPAEWDCASEDHRGLLSRDKSKNTALGDWGRRTEKDRHRFVITGAGNRTPCVETTSFSPDQH